MLCVSPVTAPRCERDVDNLGITTPVEEDERRQLRAMHIGYHPGLDPSTRHPHPGTGPEQRRHRIIHTMHSPYYCY